MKLSLFKIGKVDKDDLGAIEEWIKYCFPYTNLPKEKIAKKLINPNYLLFKHHQKNIMTGFVEIEFLHENGDVRLNAIFVEEAWRGQKIATKLLHRAIHEAKRTKSIHRLFLLVKEHNVPAKNLYRSVGFEFEQLYDKDIDESKVEVWSMYVH